MIKNTSHLRTLFLIFSAFHSCLARRICAPLSPSIQNSILRNTISMNMVCGQIHPQKIRPKATVKSVTKTTPTIIEITTKWKSWGQKGNPKKLNFLSSTLNSKNWLPLIFIKGAENRKANRK